MLKEKIQRFKDNGITPAFIARRAGISKTTIMKWLNGERDNISDDTRDKIEDAMLDIVTALTEIQNGIDKPAGAIKYDYDDDF